MEVCHETLIPVGLGPTFLQPEPHPSLTPTESMPKQTGMEGVEHWLEIFWGKYSTAQTLV